MNLAQRASTWSYIGVSITPGAIALTLLLRSWQVSAMSLPNRTDPNRTQRECGRHTSYDASDNAALTGFQAYCNLLQKYVTT